MTFIRSLFEELPSLRERGVISEDTQEKIAAHYDAEISEFDKAQEVFRQKEKERHEARKKSMVPFLVLLFSIISGVLMGSGIIYLIAFNWDSFSDALKTCIAFFILVIPQGVAGYFIFFSKKPAGKGLIEGLSALWILLFAAVMVLIGFIYKLPPDNSSFFFLWSVAALGVVYLFRSYSALAAYIVLVLLDACFIRSSGGIGTIFLIQIAALLPLWFLEKKNGNRAKSLFIKYIMIGSFITGLGIATMVSGIWIPAYANLFVFLVIASYFFKDGSAVYRYIGLAGLGVLAALLLVNPLWMETGWNFFRSGGVFNTLAAITDCLLTAGLFVGNILFAVRLILRKQMNRIAGIALFAGIAVSVVFLLVAISILNTETAPLALVCVEVCIIIFCVWSEFAFPRNILLAPVSFALFMPVLIKLITLLFIPQFQHGLVTLAFPAAIMLVYCSSTHACNNVWKNLSLAFAGVFIFIISFGNVVKASSLDPGLLIFGNSGYAVFIVASLFVAAFLTLVPIIRKKIDIHFPVILLPVMLPVLFVSVTVWGFDPEIAGNLVTLLMVLWMFFSLYRNLYKKENGVQIAVTYASALIIFIRMIVYVFALPQIWSFMFLSIPLFFVFLYFSSACFEKQIIFKASAAFKTIAIVSSGLIAFFFTFPEIIGNSMISMEHVTAGENILPVILIVTLFIGTYGMFFFMAYYRVSLNYIASLLPVALIFVLGDVLLGSSEFIGALLIMFCMLAACISGFYRGFKKLSLSTINGYVIFFIVAILVRLFMTDVSLLFRGFALVAAGAGILVLNLLLPRFFKRKKEEEHG